MKLKNKKIAVLAGELYDERELWYPYYRLKEEGARVELVGVENGPDAVKSKHGLPAPVDLSAGKADAKTYDAVIVPGGYGPDHLRRCKKVLAFVNDLFAAGKLVAFICHGGWVPVSAGILKGRKVTSFPSIRDDLVNAGAEWVDQEVVVDKNLISSRTPADLPAFTREAIAFLER